MHRFNKKETYRLVGIGNITGEQKCAISNRTGTGYVLYHDNETDMVPVDLTLFGEGRLGSEIEYIGDSSSNDV